MKWRTTRTAVNQYEKTISQEAGSTLNPVRQNGFGSAKALAVLLMTASAFTMLSYDQNRNAGEIKGTVQDQTGAAIPGVSVDAKNTATGVVTHGVTGGDGVYDLPYVAPGPYSVTFRHDGFQESTQNNILLHVETVTVNGNLMPGSVSTSIEVNTTPVFCRRKPPIYS